MDPMGEYTARLTERLAKREASQKQFLNIGNWRLATGILFAILAVAIFGPHLLPLWILILPAALFAVLVIRHQSVLRRRTFAERAVRFYEDGVERLEDRWMGRGETGERFRQPDHVYADDLDLFGKGSLFELLSCARTSMGEKTLAGWLSGPADLNEVHARQRALEELASQVDLREEIALLGEEVQAKMDPDRLSAWASRPAQLFPRLLRPFALLLAVAGVASGGLLLAGIWTVYPFAAVLICDFIVIHFLRERVNAALSGLDAPSQEVRIFAQLLARLEREKFASARLKEISSALTIAGQPASRRLANLERWIDLVDSSEHLLVRASRPVLLWREQCAFGLTRWRHENGALVKTWLKAAGDFEALSCLAAAAFERPDWCTPELSDSGQGCFDATSLRHPLLPASECVPNDLRLDSEARLAIISGSNMSGKSTLLRSVGLSTVLAWAGAPVPARALRVSRLQTGASMRVSDSLQDHRSRFFAEITRLRQIVDLAAGEVRVLFLLDELLSGTNSHDRRIGAAAIVKTLVEVGSIGLITTHDLALAEIADDLGAGAFNAHFEDQMRAGQMDFDYRLRSGVVTHSNALELMRAVGLVV